MDKQYKRGDLQVHHIPQVPMVVFATDVNSVEEGIRLIEILSDYDLFQLRHNIKPDYCNVSYLVVYSEDVVGSGIPGWEDWHHPETGEDYKEYRDRLFSEGTDLGRSIHERVLSGDGSCPFPCTSY
jgi:hypothetical protein